MKLMRLFVLYAMTAAGCIAPRYCNAVPPSPRRGCSHVLRRIAVFIKQLILPADKMHNSLDSDIRTVFPYYFFAKNYSVPVGVRNVVMKVSVCLSVCLCIRLSVAYIRNHMPKLH